MNLEAQTVRTPSDEVPTQARPISRQEILSRLGDPSLILLNVMPKETFATSHIPHSINLPVTEIENRARDVLPRLDREIIVYCMGPT
jgi:rhodanese-related sulfurtransferase